MFGLHDTLSSVWLVGLLVAWAALLLGGIAANWSSPAERRPLATRLRMASSATLVLAAWSWYLIARATPGVAWFALLLAVGMTFGLLGDLFLAEKLPIKQSFLAGMVAFALGHVAYIAAILSRSPHILWAVEAAFLLVGVGGWYLVVLRGADAGLMHWAALPYALLLATTAGLAVGLAIQIQAFAPLAIGAVLFLVSDLLVAGEQFGGIRFPRIGEVVWLTYGPAQMLIVYSVGSAVLVATR